MGFVNDKVYLIIEQNVIMNPLYITPRIAIARITSLQDLQSVSRVIQLRHKQYYHCFNLTNAKLPAEKQSCFKWRGLPFSLTEALKLLTQIDTFLRINIANAAIICVANASSEEYAKIIVKAYIDLCLSSQQSKEKSSKKVVLSQVGDAIVKSHPYFLRQMSQIYKTVSVHNPPVKYLESFSIYPEDLFIPIVEICNEGRYNDFEPVYNHSIEEELAVYYLNLNRPLQTGIGRKYYDSKPQTKYFSKPVIVFGDVKIAVYSYKTLKKVYQFTVGFNTLNIDALNQAHNSKKVISLCKDELYDRANESAQMRVQIEYSDYCCQRRCKQAASCCDCCELQKKLTNRYSEVQLQLQKLHRGRSLCEISTLLSL